MSNVRITTAIAAILIISAAPLALAQTTLGGNAKDNTASGGMENGTAAGSGKGMPMKGDGAMMKSDGMSKGATSDSNAPVANQMEKGSAPMTNGK